MFSAQRWASGKPLEDITGSWSMLSLWKSGSYSPSEILGDYISKDGSQDLEKSLCFVLKRLEKIYTSKKQIKYL